jgi:hypothetical protein
MHPVLNQTTVGETQSMSGASPARHRAFASLLRGGGIMFITRSHSTMRRFSALCAAAGLGLAALAASSPAHADPFHLIRWADTGFCQIWDEGIATTPWPSNYTIISPPGMTFLHALAFKDDMLHAGTCSF